jgi:molybdopterin-guanine dinucleotide biosynthesis protein A
MANFTLAINAGGASSRMGRNKALVEIGGMPIIERVIAATHDLGQSASVLITNQPDDYRHLGLPMFTDVIPDKGALGGIYTALHHSKTEHVLVVACDMPFLSGPLLKHMAGLLDTLSPRPDVIVPRVDGYPQGLHAINSRGCMPIIRERLDADRLKVIGFYPSVTVHTLDEADYQVYDPHGLAFFNVNTPAQLDEALTRYNTIKEA